MGNSLRIEPAFNVFFPPKRFSVSVRFLKLTIYSVDDSINLLEGISFITPKKYEFIFCKERLIMILYYGDSQRGLVRKANEDAINLNIDNLFILADGMGGYEGGQTASTLSVKAVGEYIQNFHSSAIDETCLEHAFMAANESVLKKKFDNPSLKSMGTTLLASAIQDDQLFWAHVGDSRLYRYAAGLLTQVTVDHSFVMELVNEGRLTKEQMRNHPRKNEITRAVGIEKNLKIDTGHFTLSDGTMILMCSDGVSGMLEDIQLEEIIRSNSRKSWKQLEIIGKEIMKQVYLAGARDNASLILIQYWNTAE